MKILMKKESFEKLDKILYKNSEEYDENNVIVEFRPKVKLRKNIFPKSKLQKDTSVESVKKYIESEQNDFNDYIMFRLVFFACGEFIDADEELPFDYILSSDLHIFNDKDINAMNYVAAATLGDNDKVFHEFFGYILDNEKRD